jgi:hypothetical protein
MLRKLAMWSKAEMLKSFLFRKDFQNGFTGKGVSIINPFIQPLNPVFESMLQTNNDYGWSSESGKSSQSPLF